MQRAGLDFGAFAEAKQQILIGEQEVQNRESHFGTPRRSPQAGGIDSGLVQKRCKASSWPASQPRPSNAKISAFSRVCGVFMGAIVKGALRDHP